MLQINVKIPFHIFLFQPKKELLLNIKDGGQIL